MGRRRQAACLLHTSSAARDSSSKASASPSKRTEDCDVLIVGSGMNGSALTCALGEWGGSSP